MSLVDRWLRENWLRDVDHALASTLLRLQPATSELVALAAALASRALEFGHSGVRLDDVRSLLAEIDDAGEPPALPLAAQWREALAASPFVGDGSDDAAARPLVFERDRIALRRYWDYERRLARNLRALATAPPLTPSAEPLRRRLAELFPLRDGLDRQALAAFVAQHRRVMLLTGGPGTGKTTTVARILVLRVEQARRDGVALRIALAAPTGKAAARLAEALRENLRGLCAAGQIDPGVIEALPVAASTLHRLLGWQPDSIAFRHDARRPLPFDLVVVDEASMVDLPLMCKLVDAIALQSALILIGDRDQLPSVETGDVLAALCDAAGDGRALSEQLAASASAALGVDVPVHEEAESPLSRVELAQSYRQSAALDIAPLATSIRDGAVDAAIEGLRHAKYRGIAWRSGSDAALAAVTLEIALPAYRALAGADEAPTALRMARGFRVLTAVRAGAAGSDAINAQIALALQPPGARADEFFHGRLVIIRENSYRHGLYNGDVGVCWRDASGMRVWFEVEGGLRSWLPAALPNHASAFALTVHKAQGSEFDEVLFALPERGSRVLSRELLYTGLTRARNAITLWGNEAVIAAAITRRAQRWSGLADRLRRA